VVELIPGSLRTLDMVPDNEGKWMFHCHTNMHIIAGMMAEYTVNPCTGICKETPQLLGTASPPSSSTTPHSLYCSSSSTFLFLSFALFKYFMNSFN